MRIGVIGTGNILRRIAPMLKQLENVECYAVSSRALERAQKTASELGYTKAYGSYEELVSDPNVDLVYIATPHSDHYENMMLCIRHKKPVLCEKAFTMNARQAKEVIALAKQEGVFVAEAIWTAYLPSRQLIRQTLDSGIIGKVTTLTANLSYTSTFSKRIMEPALAGGALLDLGVYGLHFAAMYFGTEVEHIDSTVLFTDTGVDATENITITYKGGRMAVLTHSVYARSDHQAVFYGDKGYLVVDNMINPQSLAVYDLFGQLVKRISVPEQINGYEYEFLECMDCISHGEIESRSMPLAGSLFIMEMADSIRKQWGLVFPQEQQ